MPSRLRFVLFLALVAIVRAASDAGQTPAEAFFQLPTFAEPQLSPDGRRLAALTRFDHRHYALALIDLETNRGEVLVKQPEVSVTDFGWKSDDLLLLSLTNDSGVRALQAIDLQTRKANPLDRIGQVVSYQPSDPTGIVCVWNDWSLRRFDVRTGKSETIERPVLGIERWIVDEAGGVWAGIGYLGEKWILIWRSDPGAPWQRREQHGIHRAQIFPLAVIPEKRRLVVLERAEGATTRLAYFNLKDGTTEEIHREAHVDVTALKLWGRRREPAAAIYATDRERSAAFLPEAETCYRLLGTALPELDCNLISFSRDDQRIIVRGTSDREAGIYYLLDRKTGRLGLVGTALPALPARQLASSRFFEFKSRDGLALTGRITLPRDVPRPPLLVRTGPALVGPRSAYEYDSVAQFLASRGFASVRIDARGTDGFGSELLRAGDLQIAGTVIDDLEDGVDYLAREKLVDEKRVGLFGVSDGGITAVHAALRGRFKVWVNIGTPMTLQKRDLEQLVPSDRDNAELTQLLGGSGPASAYLKSLDPLEAAARVAIPSFHNYARGPSSFEMTESGRLLQSVLKKSPAPHVFHLEPPTKPETDEAKLTGARFEAMAAFLRKYL